MPATSPQSSWSDTITIQNRLNGLCLILDRDSLRIDILDAAALALTAGVRFIQYRNKDDRGAVYDVCSRLVPLIHDRGGICVINDHADIATAVGADGVHLGQDDLPILAARALLGPGKVIGLSTHTVAQALAAQASGADYIGFGPVFDTTTKNVGEARGLDLLRTVASRVSIPVFAIGGITRASASAVMETGAAGAAVISAICSATDVQSAARGLLDIIDGFRSHQGGER